MDSWDYGIDSDFSMLDIIVVSMMYYNIEICAVFLVIFCYISVNIYEQVCGQYREHTTRDRH